MCKLGEVLRIFEVRSSEPLVGYRNWLEDLEPTWAPGPLWRTGEVNQ